MPGPERDHVAWDDLERLVAALAEQVQARGYLADVPSEVFQSLPYAMTVVVLVLVSSSGARRRLGAPGSLGVPYVREEGH
jgi:ABC-type uncharacterized transport system permease subunit